MNAPGATETHLLLPLVVATMIATAAVIVLGVIVEVVRIRRDRRDGL